MLDLGGDAAAAPANEARLPNLTKIGILWFVLRLVSKKIRQKNTYFIRFFAEK